MRMKREFDILRHARTSAILLLYTLSFCVLSTVVGHMSNDDMSVVSFGLGLVATPFAAAPIEWIIHRHVYHRKLGFFRRLHTIHLTHHAVDFPAARYTTSGRVQRIPIFGEVAHRSSASNWQNRRIYLYQVGFYLMAAAGMIWAPAWLLSNNVSFLLGLILGSIIISNLVIDIHDSMHRPGSHKFIEARGWYSALNKHHYLHHLDHSVNFSSFLPLTDWLFGTLRQTRLKRTSPGLADILD